LPSALNLPPRADALSLINSRAQLQSMRDKKLKIIFSSKLARVTARKRLFTTEN
jgi:hypothetical protein